MHLPVMRLAALAGAMALAGPARAHEPAPTATTHVTLPAAASEAAAVVDAFHAALDRGDGAAASALLADDALIFEGGGAERSKAQYAAEHLGADMAFSKAVPSKLVRRSGGVEGPLAWIASEGRTTGTWKGKAVDSITTETMVLRRAGDGWSIVHIHWSSAPAPSN
jgi:ketosteroid isomerase-like protein